MSKLLLDVLRSVPDLEDIHCVAMARLVELGIRHSNGHRDAFEVLVNSVVLQGIACLIGKDKTLLVCEAIWAGFKMSCTQKALPSNDCPREEEVETHKIRRVSFGGGLLARQIIPACRSCFPPTRRLCTRFRRK